MPSGHRRDGAVGPAYIQPQYFSALLFQGCALRHSREKRHLHNMVSYRERYAYRHSGESRNL